MRTYVYIDGFNFYYRAVKDTPYKWLDFNTLFQHLLSHEIFAPLAKPEGNKRFVRIIKTEEKGSDVNLAIHVLNDAWLVLYDCIVIVSNDSDLAESLRLVTNKMTIESFFMASSYLSLRLETKALQNGCDPQFQIKNNH